jgi:hypothetical protein
MSAVPNFVASQVLSDGQRTELLIRSILTSVRTAIPVKVLAVYPGAGTPPSIGTVDVQPLVQMVDASNTLWPLKPNYGVPFCRIQSGNTAIVADPQVDDIGIAVACDRDISSVLASANYSIANGQPVQPANPGSARKHNLSDLVYLFSIISAASITQYLQITASLLKAVFPSINLNGVTIDGSGDLSAPTLAAGNGASGTVTTETGYTMVFQDGICTSITT